MCHPMMKCRFCLIAICNLRTWGPKELCDFIFYTCFIEHKECIYSKLYNIYLSCHIWSPPEKRIFILSHYLRYINREYINKHNVLCHILMWVCVKSKLLFKLVLCEHLVVTILIELIFTDPCTLHPAQERKYNVITNSLRVTKFYK